MHTRSRVGAGLGTAIAVALLSGAHGVAAQANAAGFTTRTGFSTRVMRAPQNIATLHGIVRDESGGVLPGVHLTASSVDTGATRQTVTGPDGRFTLGALPVG